MNLRVEEIDFQQIVENSLHSKVIVGRDGKIHYCNQAFVNLLSLPSIHDILNQDFIFFYPPHFREACKKGLSKVIENQEIVNRVEAKILKYNGEMADVELMSFPFYYQSQVLALVMIQDITEKKLTEKKIKDREKLVSLGQLAAGLVHEVKNPLTAVKGFLQLMKESEPHPYLSTMEGELDKAFDTLQNLLQVSKPDLLEEPVVPIALCKELRSTLLLFQEKLYSIEVELELRDADKLVYGKRNLLLKSFFNLIKNAIEAIKGPGKIRIEHYYFSGAVHIKVGDTGEGIPEDKLIMIGTPFYSSKPDGTGLGLTQVFTTIHEHGGSISVESAVGKGTAFHIQLPVR